MTLKVLIGEAEKLSRDEQVELLDELYCMIGNAQTPLALTPSQEADLDRRIQEYRSGKASVIPGDEAIAQLRKRA